MEQDGLRRAPESSCQSCNPVTRSPHACAVVLSREELCGRSPPRLREGNRRGFAVHASRVDEARGQSFQFRVSTLPPSAVHHSAVLRFAILRLPSFHPIRRPGSRGRSPSRSAPARAIFLEGGCPQPPLPAGRQPSRLREPRQRGRQSSRTADDRIQRYPHCATLW